MKGSCKLCGHNALLQSGHVIPKLFFTYLKRTSVTGCLRSAGSINKRIQDGDKSFMLCGKCEGLFSRRESSFSDLLYRPYMNDNNLPNEYGEWLRYFMVSIFWRIALIQIEDYDKEDSSGANLLREAMYIWKLFLLEKSNNPGSYQYNIFFTGKGIATINHPTLKVPGMNWPLLRGIDYTIFIKSKVLGIYFRVPGIIFCCHIKPMSNRQWKGTIVGRKGLLNKKQQIDDRRFNSFLINRLKNELSSMNGMSEHQRQMIENDYRLKFDSNKHNEIGEIIIAESEYFMKD